MFGASSGSGISLSLVEGEPVNCSRLSDPYGRAVVYWRFPRKRQRIGRFSARPPSAAAIVEPRRRLTVRRRFAVQGRDRGLIAMFRCRLRSPMKSSLR